MQSFKVQPLLYQKLRIKLLVLKNLSKEGSRTEGSKRNVGISLAIGKTNYRRDLEHSENAKLLVLGGV